MIDDTTGTGIPTVETHDGLRWGCKIVQRGDGLFDVVSACGVFYLGCGLWYTLPSDPIDVGVFDDEHYAAKWLSDTKCAPPSWYAAELARVQAQRDALAEACRMVVRRWDDARLDDSDMDALRAALSTGGGK